MNRNRIYIKKISANKINQIDKEFFVINQSLIAKNLGISESYVSKLLSGKRHSKKYETKIKNIIERAVKKLRAA